MLHWQDIPYTCIWLTFDSGNYWQTFVIFKFYNLILLAQDRQTTTTVTDVELSYLECQWLGKETKLKTLCTLQKDSGSSWTYLWL